MLCAAVLLVAWLVWAAWSYRRLIRQLDSERYQWTEDDL